MIPPPTINPDDTPENANWHTAAWDLPTTPTTLLQLLARLGMTVEAFEQTSAYRANVDKIPWLRDLRTLVTRME
jgi:hypothetical protein